MAVSHITLHRRLVVDGSANGRLAQRPTPGEGQPDELRQRRAGGWEPEYDPLSEFEDLESWDSVPNSDPPKATEADDDAASPDDGPAVTVSVTEVGAVTSVVLAASWRRSVDPRELHSEVLSAANSAMMQALANQVGQAEQTQGASTSGAPTGIPDTSPLSKHDVLRLVDAVSADLNRFTEQLSTRVEQTVSAESSGGHVRGSAQRGQILDVWIDSRWASSARNSEIELELTDVLKRLGELSSPGDMMHGPQSQAINELRALASDPQLFLRRVGLLP